MTPFELAVASELTWLVRAGVPPHGIRVTVRELLVTRMGRGPLGAGQVRDTVEAAVRAACRLVGESDAPDQLVEIVCRAALEAVRGHGGTTSQWLAEATGAVQAVLDDLAASRAGEGWVSLARRLSVM